jgi:glycosyltransferase involved in cell wall biosynthesis
MANAASEKFQVSVVVATYNRATILPENIESVLNQDFDSYEAIYVDDGSSDATQEVLAEWSARAKAPFTIIYTENVGPGPARNAGVAAARGEYVMFLDDDATVPSNWIATMVERCTSHACDVLCGGIGAYSIEEPVAHYLHLRMQRALGRSGNELKGAPTGNLLIRRAVFEQVGGFADEPLPAAEDWELSYRLRQAGARIVYDSAVSIVHRFQTEMEPALKRMRTTGAVGVLLARRMHGRPLLYTLYSVARIAVSPVWIAGHYPAKLWWLSWRMEAALVGARVKAWMRLARGKPVLDNRGLASSDPSP